LSAAERAPRARRRTAAAVCAVAAATLALLSWNVTGSLLAAAAAAALAALAFLLPGRRRPPSPAAPPPPDPAVRAAEACRRALLAGKRVLVADQDAAAREEAVRPLLGAGMHVDVASDGREAIVRARAITYDAILVDRDLPLIDGARVRDTVRRFPTGNDVIVVMLCSPATGRDDPESGVGWHLAKPVDADLLLTTLARALAGSAGPSAATPHRDQVRLRELLGEIDGLDVALGRRYVGGDATYVRLLRRFALRQRAALGKLPADLAAGDPARLEEAAIAMHALKGAAATLGATRVHALARDLEPLLRDRALDRAAPLAAALDAELARLTDAILARLPDPTPTGHAPPAVSAGPGRDARVVESVVARLTELLEADSLEARELFLLHEAELSARLGPAADVLAAEIADLDYTAALATLRGMLGESRPH